MGRESPEHQVWFNRKRRCVVGHLSTAFTLEPADVVSTGTPQGVGMGFDPPRRLREGEVVRIEVEGIGTLENPVAAEPEHQAWAGS